MKWLTADLADLTGRRGMPTALILVLAHVLIPLLVLPLWAFGLLPVFVEDHWIPAILVSVCALAVWIGLGWRFGFVAAYRGRTIAWGEQYTDNYSPRTAFALTCLRWVLQILACLLVMLPVLMTWTNTRWWHLAGTEELDALPAQAEAMPTPDNWRVERTRASETGFPEVAFSTQFDGSEPMGYVETTFEVPGAYTLDDLEQWLQDPAWEGFPGDGDPFGDLTLEKCDSQSTRCTAQFVPSSGDEPEYFVIADLDRLSTGGSGAELEVRLEYHAYEAPDWGISQETVDRARSVPVPSDWVRYDARAGTSSSGEEFTQSYGVPESFTREDLEAWIRGDSWADPTSGEPFGKLHVDECRETGVDEDSYLCSAVVAGTENTAENSSYDGPVEVLSVSLSADHTVRVKLARNG